MKLLSLVFVCLSPLLLTVQVQGYCHALLSFYYNCKANNYAKTSKGHYYLTKSLKDSFFNDTLKGFKTFPEAANHFKSIFSEVKSCTAAWCDCSRYLINSYIYQNYTFFFNSSAHYPHLVSILNKVKTSYTLLSHDKIEEQTGYFNFQEFYPNYPFLNDFCLLNDFSFEFLVFYKETLNCEKVVYDRAHDCMSSYLGLNIYTHNLTEYSRAQLEDYSSCITSLIPKCDQEIKRAIQLTHLYEYPWIIQSNNLTAYIDTLIKKNAPVRMERTSSFIDWGFLMESINQGFQFCNFDTQTYSIINSTSLRIQGTASNIMGLYDGISKITIDFIYDSKTNRTYSASNDSFPLAFDSRNSTVVLGPNNQKWLEMKVVKHIYEEDDDELVSVIILDYKTNSTILIHDCEYTCTIELVAPKSLFGSSKGLMVDGCVEFTEEELNELFYGGEEKKRRRKRSVLGRLNVIEN